jgi:hypothetical protein
MIEFINPVFLYITSFIGSLGIIWSIKYSNNKTIEKLAPVINMRQSILLAVITNFLVLLYIILHIRFISKMLIEPGFIESSGGSGGGFFWSNKHNNWSEKTKEKYELYKLIKDITFVSANIFFFLIAFILRLRNKSKISSETTKKTSLRFTVLLIIFAFLLSYITLGGVVTIMDDYFIWEGE